MDREPGSPRGCKGSATTERLTHSSALGTHVHLSSRCVGSRAGGCCLATSRVTEPPHPGLSLGQPEAWGWWEPHQGCDPARQPLTCASAAPRARAQLSENPQQAGEASPLFRGVPVPSCARSGEKLRPLFLLAPSFLFPSSVGRAPQWICLCVYHRL